jgi:hypothetical protein
MATNLKGVVSNGTNKEFSSNLKTQQDLSGIFTKGTNQQHPKSTTNPRGAGPPQGQRKGAERRARRRGQAVSQYAENISELSSKEKRGTSPTARRWTWRR